MQHLWDRHTGLPKEVMVKVGDSFEKRAFSVLGSQVKQSIHDQLKAELKGLSTKKQQGEKVGRLQFKSRVIPNFDRSPV